MLALLTRPILGGLAFESSLLTLTRSSKELGSAAWWNTTTASAASSSERVRSGQHASSSTTAAAGASDNAVTPRPPRDPWTPTRQLDKRKAYPKRMKHLITTLENEYVAKANAARGAALPPFRAGDVLEVDVVVPEAERRVYTYRGVCLARDNRGPRSAFKVFNVFPDIGGFVQHFPLHMPDLLAVRVVGRIARARRARLNHLLADESAAQTYQSTIPPPKPAPKG